MSAPAAEAWLGDEAVVPSATLATLWALMAQEGPCPPGPIPSSSSSPPLGSRHRRRLARPGTPRASAAPSHRLSPLALLARTRLHGLRQACAPAASVGRRAFWTLALCTSVGLLLSWSSNRLLHWLAFPTHTRVHTEWARELPFPTVTICNNNPVRLYHLTKSDLYFAGHWLGLLLANRTARPLVLDLLHEERRGWFRKLSDFRLFLPPRRFEGTSLEFMDRLGHQLDDMLLGCKYRGEPCGAHNFSTVSAPLSISLSLYISRSIFLPFAFIFVFISLRLKSCQGTC
ncbi:acid-sensing ion channel 2-like [Astyanax mexicanus]|uniref:Acid-sensing ion channel 2-like n=1 Tax=Astyanax mexicanus TaxID=7994 RepID=A0A8T2L5G0_ASTMX|nr:acid-sensing ion channel 2-like [Astyanax mexicanus]